MSNTYDRHENEIKHRKTPDDVKVFISNNKRKEKFIKMEYKKGKDNRNRLYLTLECENGHTYEQMWDNFKKGHGCILCGYESNKKKQRKYDLDYVKIVLNDNNYEIVDENEYVNAGKAFRCRCLICGDISKLNFGSVLNGRKCKVCIGMAKKTTDQFKKEVSNITNNEYVLRGEYITAQDKVHIEHKICNSVYEVTPHNFLRGKRCPVCNSSKGETEIRRYLNSKGYWFKEQYRIDNCKNTLPLPFDFAIFNDSEHSSLKCLIEYDGIQHYEPVDLFGGLDGYSSTKNNDDIKTKYCEMNQIPLITIPYWDFNNIGEILDKKILNWGELV